ncbi:hypothetical protein [Zoogloea sp.]|uniref:hypothetical protein n=1 Tax=Zoogloea sp. TaxID=49181 RepID=UPI001B5AB047|nr:hypothetical protein [Zoogloea sp.]MBK6656068.1 hypothetical protein [Zoogloea sp.]MBP7446003.1 hypothetical protein [Zoogloea sp.]
MTLQTHGDFSFQPYAVPRRDKDGKWDGWYDLFGKNGRSLRSFVRVPSREGFDDPKQACEAAEILAEWDIEAAYRMKRPSAVR